MSAGDELPWFLQDGADEKLASLRKELEVFVRLLNSFPREILKKTAVSLNPYCLCPAEVGKEMAKQIDDWFKAPATKTALFQFLFKSVETGEDHKVNGKFGDWSSGGMGSRWADTMINGRNCRFAFYSRKNNFEYFDNESCAGYDYRLMIDATH